MFGIDFVKDVEVGDRGAVDSFDIGRESCFGGND
jgi:hypothetical protein